MIHYLKGDATCPQAPGPKIICHVCNDMGGWGKGFVLAISKRWEAPERAYRTAYNKGEIKLGVVQYINVGQNITIANMVAQHGLKSGSKGPPIRYDYLDICLTKVVIHANNQHASIHMPRIGCGLAGGKWDRIEPLLLKHAKIDFYVYDF